MKIFPYLLLFITCHAVGQDIPYPTDSMYLVPADLIDMIQQAKVKPKVLPIKLRKVVVHELQMGWSTGYSPETDVQVGNDKRSKTKAIIYQIPLGQTVTDEQKGKIETAIHQILEGTIVVPPSIIDTVDASNSTFTGTWRVGDTTAPNWFAETIAWSNTTGSEVTYKHPLPYKRIEIYGEYFTSHGKIGISIDQGQEVIIDLYSPTRKLPSLLHAFDVPMGEHEVKIRVTGEKNAASTGTFGLVDYYRVFR